MHEASLIPELAVHRRRAAEAHRALIIAAIAPAFAGTPPPALLGVLATLLDFRSWQSLIDQYGLSETAAADAIANAARLVFNGYATT